MHGTSGTTSMCVCPWCCWLVLCSHLIRPQLGVVGNNVKGSQCGQCATQGVAWQQRMSNSSSSKVSVCG